MILRMCKFSHGKNVVPRYTINYEKFKIKMKFSTLTPQIKAKPHVH